jgi:PAS domain S-box-containing protein
MSQTFDTVIAVGVGLLAALLTGNAVAAFFNTRQLNGDAAWVAHTHEVIDALRDLSSTVKDAETGQRDYLLTGEDAYLDPYRAAVSTATDKIDRVQGLTLDNRGQQERIPRLREVVAADLDQLRRVADLRNDKDADPARRLPAIRESRTATGAVNGLVGEMEKEERDLLLTRQTATDRAYFVAVLTGLLSDGVGLLAYVLLVWFGRLSLQARARAAALLRHERELLHATLSSIGDGVIAADADGRVTFLNAVAENLTGWTTAEAVRRPIDDVFRIANEQTRQPVETPVARVLREGNIVGLANHTVLLARDGTVRPIDDSAAPIRDGKQGVSGVILVFRDVAERRRAEETLRENEERLRLAQEGGGFGSWEWTIASNRVLWSPSLEAIHGLAPGTFPARSRRTSGTCTPTTENPSFVRSGRRWRGARITTSNTASSGRMAASTGWRPGANCSETSPAGRCGWSASAWTPRNGSTTRSVFAGSARN